VSVPSEEDCGGADGDPLNAAGSRALEQGISARSYPKQTTGRGGGTRLNDAPMTVTSPRGALRRRPLKPYQRRALTLLAGCGSAGCQEAVMHAHGFTADQLTTMVHIGFAATTTERVVGSVGQISEIKSFKITEAGDEALGRNPTHEHRPLKGQAGP
jgi:hypothetical protein